MDKIEKALRRFTEQDRKRIKYILEKIDQRQFVGLNLKKLRGHNDIFRVRKGDIRIIFRQGESGKISILAIERRTKKTYKAF